MGSAFLTTSYCTSPPSAPPASSTAAFRLTLLAGTCVAHCLLHHPISGGLFIAFSYTEAFSGVLGSTFTARRVLAHHTCDTQASRRSDLPFDSLLPGGVTMGAIRGLSLAGAYVALLVALSSSSVPTFLPLLLSRVLRWILVVCLVYEVNSTLNAWAENRWLFTSDKSSWQWTQELAVVTGGSNGIGAAVVKELVSHGVKVAVLDIQPLSEAFQNGARHASIMTHT